MYKDQMPKKALICYCPTQPTQPISKVNLVVEKGCSGQMAIEGPDDTIIVQLLGLYNEKKDSIKSTFKKRFNDLSLAIISNSDSVKEIASDLNSSYSLIESTEQIQSLLSSESIDVIFIDFTNYHQPWNFINDLISVKSVNYIQCIISPYTANDDKLDQFTSIKPRQSYLMKDGTEITNINKETELMYAYYHSGSGRTDNSTQYTVQNIKENAGNRKILAWHFLAEIGHKLGFVPKYGA